MTRFVVIAGVLVAIAGVGFWVGLNRDAVQEKERDIQIIEEFTDAVTDDRTDLERERRLRELAGR